VGSSESEVEAVKARDREAYDECRGAKENCGCATEEMGSGESEEGRLIRQKERGDEGREGGSLWASAKLRRWGPIRTDPRITLPRTPFLRLQGVAHKRLRLSHAVAGGHVWGIDHVVEAQFGSRLKIVRTQANV
jgi:hypothetical protein